MSQGCRKESSEIRYVGSRSLEWNGWVSGLSKSWQYITLGGFSRSFLHDQIFFCAQTSFTDFLSVFWYYLSFQSIHTHTPLCAPVSYDLKWWEFFSIFFIITLLNKTPSSDVWFQCYFFLSPVQFESNFGSGTFLVRALQKPCFVTSSIATGIKSAEQKFNGLNI